MTVDLTKLSQFEVVYQSGNIWYFNGTGLTKINTGISAANTAIANLQKQVATLQATVAALVASPPPPVIPPDTNVYPLTMTPVANPGDPVTLGKGPDQIVLLLSQIATDNPKSEIAILMDGVAIAGPLFVTSTGNNQVFTINGSWGPSPHKIEIVGAGAGLSDLGIGGVSYNFVPYVNNGPATFRQDSPHVNAPSVWDNYNLATTWTLPIVVAPPPPPPPSPTATVINAAINGTPFSGTLDQCIANTPTGGTLTLPAGTFVGTSLVETACNIVGAGIDQTIIDGTNMLPKHEKGGLVPTLAGVKVSGMTIKNFSIPGSDGGNASSIRDDGPGMGCTLTNFKSTGNQDGILTSGGSWTLDSCIFMNNGAGNPGSGATHEMYFSSDTNNTVTLINVIAACGPLATHALKSRAKVTNVSGGVFTANFTDPTNGGNAGSVIDIPECGSVTIDSSTINLPAGSSNRNFVTYGMENTNGASFGLAVKLTNCIFVDGTGTGGGIVSGNPNATLDITGSKYTGNVAPNLTGWASVTGSFTKA